MGFKENLRKYREASGLTAKDFAATIGLNYGTYISYETAGKEPRYDTLKKIAAALHVSIDTLLDNKPDGLAKWGRYLNNTDISLIDKGEEIEVVIDLDGVNCHSFTGSRSVILQIFQLAERKATKDLAAARKAIICNELREMLLHDKPVNLI